MKLFRKTGNTSAISATTTSANVALSTTGGNFSQIAVYNAGSVDVFVAFGTSSSIAAVVPSSGSPANGSVVPPGQIRGYTVSPDTSHVAAITGSSTATVYVEPGEGL